MKRTQIKDTLRNIARQKVPYLSIIVIALLGVTTFLSIDYSVGAMRRNGSAYYNGQNFRDIEMVSTLLFSPEDLKSIRAVEGVEDVETVLQVSAKASAGEDKQKVSVVSLTERISLPELLEGRLPESAAECAVERRLADVMGWQVGEQITLRVDDSGAEYLRETSFALTGIVNHPDHVNYSVPDTLYVLVREEAFDREALDGQFMKAELLIHREADVDRFSKAYAAKSAAVTARLEELGRTAVVRRDTQVHETVQTEIDANQEKLDAAKAELERARKTLDDGWKALAEGEQALADGKAQLEDFRAQLDASQLQLVQSREQLDAAESELADGEARVNAAWAELETARAELDSGRAELESGWTQLEDAKEQIRSAIRQALESVCGDTTGIIAWAGRMPADTDSAEATAMDFWITENYRYDLGQSLREHVLALIHSNEITDALYQAAYEKLTGSLEGYTIDKAREKLREAMEPAVTPYVEQYEALRSACAQWDEGHGMYLSGFAQYEEGLAQYQQGLAEYEAGRSRYEAGLAEYESGLARYEDGEAQYQQALTDYAAGQRELEETRRKLTQGEEDYKNGLAALDSGTVQITETIRWLSELEPCRWLVFDQMGNAGMAQMNIASYNLESLESTFSLMFLLVGALVIFATVSKIVDEQRSLVGTTKALGFFNREIFGKYVSFGASATVIGTILGILAAGLAVQRVLLNGFDTYYVFDMTAPAIFAKPTMLVVLAGVALAVAAVWAACRKLLGTPAIVLMQPRVPGGVKKTAKAGKRALSLYSRLILLNMRTDLRRVIVTVVSVAGCCALAVIGLTLRGAVGGAIENQYSGIVAYDQRVRFDSAVSADAQGEIEEILRGAGADYTALFTTDASYYITDHQLAELLCGDLTAISALYHLDDWKTGEPIPADVDGILIQRRMAELYDLDVGDELELTLEGEKTVRVRVGGIFEHFIGRPMFMDKGYYEKVLGKTFPANTFFLRRNGADQAALEAALRQVEGLENITAADADRSLFEASISVVNTVVALFILMAAIMAGVVLLNLTSMYVLQKKREVTIMRINGFTVGEVVGYLTRETVVTTALGILLGLALGSGVAYRIIRLMEQSFFQFDRRVNFLAWLIAAGITVLFTVLVNLVALRPVKHLKLTDIA